MKFTPASTLAAQRPARSELLTARAWPALYLLLFGLALAVSGPPSALADDALHAGLLYDEFKLTLAPGHRTEAVGPFYYSEQKETQRIWAVPPLLSYTRDPGTESKELDILYPVITYDRYGEQ